MRRERKKDDTGPPITDQLVTDGSADDLTGVNGVSFTMWNPRTETVIVDKNSSEVTVTDPGSGKVKYDFSSTDLSDTGRLFYEWEVDFGSGRTVTYPNDKDGNVIIVNDDGA